MSDLAIHVDSLGKRYHLGARQRMHGTLRERLTEAAVRPVQRLRSALRGRSALKTEETLWALRDVSFDVPAGEVVGVIGRNGAGKTTLLKILSRITDPTRGRAEIHGRVASLLEVGTGFHPELTGRENVYLNGSILGMSRTEIDRRFDAIVSFAEVERFLDTQVKNYSSGMYLRLAFAVAAHLEPEILLIDEILAVGDASFQRKCLGKMDEVAQHGRTVLFVSHNLAAIARLCHRCILLDGGRIVADGPTASTLRTYGALVDAADDEAAADEAPLALRILGVEPATDQGLDAGRPFRVELGLGVREEVHRLSLRLSLRDAEDRLIVYDRLEGRAVEALSRPSRHRISIELPALWLAPGLYSLSAKAIGDHGTSAKTLRSVAGPLLLQVTNPSTGDPSWPGAVRPVCAWTIERESRGR
jgi:lipopolysaccharide transport system ATP-binding protein